jgi:predicted enzyme related to lactoylglutathione lyase
MKKKMDPVVHFEMPYDDPKRVAAFYASAFGWETSTPSGDFGGYVLATTTEMGEGGRPRDTGAINGGFYPKKPDWPAQYPSVVIAVVDIKESMKKVAKAGGKVLGEPNEIPGIGLYVSFYDTEGNRVAILQPNPRM